MLHVDLEGRITIIPIVIIVGQAVCEAYHGYQSGKNYQGLQRNNPPPLNPNDDGYSPSQLVVG